MNKNKRGQEEIVGFVLVVLLVSIILIVFLSIFLKKDKENVGNPEISQFLDSISEITTKCTLNGGFYYENYVELLKNCYDGKLCDRLNSCDLLRDITKESIENSWVFEENSLRKGYIFNSFYISDDEQSNSFGGFPISNLTFTTCNNNKYGDERSFPINDGHLLIKMEICLD